MKRILCLMMATALVTGLLSGCAANGAKTAAAAPADILSYEKLDPSKTPFYVAMLGNNAEVRKLSDAFEESSPDVQVICIDITGGNAAYKPVADWVKHGAAPDVMFVNPDSFVDNDFIAEYLEELSGNPVVERYSTDSLDRIAVEGHVYFLPAPSEINCMAYNKTLFEQYGWKTPVTFDEFTALCVQIKEDTDGTVQPWNPNAKYDSVLTTALEGFTYEALFGGADNRGWYNDFCAGSAGYASHMAPFYSVLQTLIDDGILLEEHFTYSATTRGKEFQAGKIAMINAPVSDLSNGADANGDSYTFGFIPYPTTAGETGYVNEYYSSFFCVPKRERTEAERDIVNRYIDFLSSIAGQQALIGDTLMVSNVEDVPLKEVDELAEVNDAIKRGHRFSRLDFPGTGERTWTFKDNALCMLKGEKTGEELMAEIEKKPYKTTEEATAEPSPKLAEVTKDLNILDFSCYIADMYRERANADIGLINHGVAYRGNLVRLFAGDILESYVTVLKPRSFDNDSALVKVAMTGQQLMDALQHPMGNDCVTNSVYAFSGLKCEVAPWNDLGTKYLSVKLADGSPLEMDKLYTVGIWAGTVADEYITDTLETYAGTWEEHMTAKLKTTGVVVPAEDGRIKLVWE